MIFSIYKIVFLRRTTQDNNAQKDEKERGVLKFQKKAFVL